MCHFMLHLPTLLQQSHGREILARLIFHLNQPKSRKTVWAFITHIHRLSFLSWTFLSHLLGFALQHQIQKAGGTVQIDSISVNTHTQTHTRHARECSGRTHTPYVCLHTETQRETSTHCTSAALKQEVDYHRVNISFVTTWQQTETLQQDWVFVHVG